MYIVKIKTIKDKINSPAWGKGNPGGSTELPWSQGLMIAPGGSGGWGGAGGSCGGAGNSGESLNAMGVSVSLICLLLTGLTGDGGGDGGGEGGRSIGGAIASWNSPSVNEIKNQKHKNKNLSDKHYTSKNS